MATLLCLFLALTCPLVGGMVYQIPDTAIRVELAKLGISFSLNCTGPGSSSTPTDVTPLYWVLSDRSLLKVSSQNSNPWIANNGWKLHVKDVKMIHLGLYSCIYEVPNANTNETVQMTEYYVNLYEKSEWQAYRLQTIVGLVAAATALVIMAGLCLVYAFRWTADETEIRINKAYDFSNADYYQEDQGAAYEPPYLIEEKKIEEARM